MRRRFTWIIWLVLVALTASSPLWGSKSTFLTSVFAGQLDPTQWFVFNALGLFPLYFFILARNDQQPHLRSLLYLSGMVLGGFIIFPLEVTSKTKPQPLTKLNLTLLVSMDLLFIGLLIWALIFGDWSLYSESYRNDLFVYVMTWDFFAFLGVLTVKIIASYKTYFNNIMNDKTSAL